MKKYKSLLWILIPISIIVAIYFLISFISINVVDIDSLKILEYQLEDDIVKVKVGTGVSSRVLVRADQTVIDGNIYIQFKDGPVWGPFLGKYNTMDVEVSLKNISETEYQLFLKDKNDIKKIN